MKNKLIGCIALAVILAGCASWGPWEITKPATCTEAAQEQRTHAEDASKVQTRNSRANPALGHEGLTGEVAPTCTVPGRTGSGTCTRCGENVAPRAVNALGHNWGSWQRTKDPTTTAEGEDTRVCSRDNSHRETRVVEKLPNIIGSWLWQADTTVWPIPGWSISLDAPNLLISGSLTITGKELIEKETGVPDTENLVSKMWWISRYTISGDRLTWTIDNKQTTFIFNISADGNTLTLRDQRDNTVRVFTRTK